MINEAARPRNTFFREKLDVTDINFSASRVARAFNIDEIVL